MHDMLTLLALPAIWTGRSPAATLDIAIDTLSSLARLDVVYARLIPHEGQRQGQEAMQFLGRATRDEQVIATVREGIRDRLKSPGTGSCDLPGAGTVPLLVAQLGFYGGTGVIAFGALRPGFPTPAESMLLRAAANLLTTAVEGARLVEEAQVARSRATFLAEVSEALSSATQVIEVPLAAAAKLAIERVAEVCVVELWQAANSSISVAALAHRDADKIAEARELQSHPAVREQVENVIRVGRPRLYPLAAGTAPPRTVVTAPITSGAMVIGAVSLFAPRESVHYGAADLEMAEDFGRRLGVALEVARLAQDARDDVVRKDEFLAMLAHELRNPLAPILSAIQLLRLRGTEAFKEHEIIERQVRHIVRLVDDLLDISRITRGKVDLKVEPLLIAEVLARAIEIANPLIEQASHQLTLRIDPPAARVMGDGVRLAQIFANLLTNAAKYSLPGARITVVASCDGTTLKISVRDTGIGIPAALLPKVFDLFVQGERGLDRSQGGLGIGLALVRSLVESHHGTVSVHSDGPGKGSEFVVRLPSAPQLSPRLPAVISFAEKIASTRVLVVDDNVDAAELLGEILQSYGHQIAVAHDGPRALLLAASFQPSVAVVDIGLPIMDGYELAGRLRLLPGLQDLRLIALSGYGQSDDKTRSRQAGFNVHLVKPAELDTIVAAISVPADTF
jgi:signal transduction histidine kinase/CheY-like chemotaxis protein